MTEPTDAVYWVADEAGDRPYSTQFMLISEEMIAAALHPADVLLVSVRKLRMSVQAFVDEQNLTKRGKATLAISWVQPIEELPPSATRPATDGD